MADCMTFPETLEEFLEQYQFKDTEKIYTNGSMLIPVFRVKQWAEHTATDAVDHDMYKTVLDMMLSFADRLEKIARIARGG